MDNASPSVKVIYLILFVLVVTTTAQNTRCPFDYLYHFGDGVFDNGNAIANIPTGSRLPAANPPYGVRHIQGPTGRWCDGLLDIDYGAEGLGFPHITAYLAPNSSSGNAIMFAVARSPVLDPSFFRARGIRIPAYAASLSVQVRWFRQWLNTSSSPAERFNRLVNSIFLFGDIEANDITFALIQGRSIREVRTYIRSINQAQINAARELINMGATRVILPGNAPMGCYPFILTELASNNSTNYDDIGCLRSVNDLMIAKNNDLQAGVARLRREFPNTMVMYADFYNTELQLIRELSVARGRVALQSCCGIGGNYNYDSNRFCGSRGVPVCSNPNQYFFWDGIHLTQEANYRLSILLAAGAVPTLSCNHA